MSTHGGPSEFIQSSHMQTALATWTCRRFLLSADRGVVATCALPHVGMSSPQLHDHVITGTVISLYYTHAGAGLDYTC